jgi:hypothetical protein
MEEFRPSRTTEEQDRSARERSEDEDLPESGRDETLSTISTDEEIVSRVRGKSDKRAGRRRWGQILVVLGIVTVLDSCSFFPIPLAGAASIWVGAALILAGSGFLLQSPRLKATNEAILVAMKYGNRLTVPRLALEMDVSLKKAEKIIGRLVAQGVAEIDLDAGGPDDGITYRIRGV